MLYLIISLAMFFWGGNWTAAKLITGFGPAPVMVFWRFFATLVLFTPLLYFRKISIRVPRPYIGLVILASFFMAFYQFNFFKGLQTGLAGAGGILVTTTNPMFSFVLDSFVRRQWPSRQSLIGLCIGAVGALFLLEIWRVSFSELFQHGNTYFLLGSLSWAICTVISKRVPLNAVAFTFYTYTSGIFLGFFLSPKGALLASVSFPLYYWGIVAYLATFGTIFSSSAYFYGIQHLGVEKGSSFVLLVPVFAWSISFVILDEPLQWYTLFGGALSMLSIYVINKTKTA